ncbi:macrolide ABC transporter ATP-binding protein, partial [Rothia aeria]
MNNEYTPSNGLTASPFAPAARGTAPANTYAYDGAHHSTAHTAQPNAPQHTPAARPGPQYAPAPQAPHAGPPAPTQPPHASPAAPTSAAGAVPARPVPDAPVPTAAVPAASTSAPGTAAPVISA